MVLTKKVEENRITEKEYRAIKGALNYSALRTYLSSRKAFVKEYVLGESRSDEESVSTLIGHLCHTLLSNIDGEFDRCYAIASVKEPVGQMLELCQVLYKYTVKGLDGEGKQTRQFEQLFLDAVQECKYDYDLKEKAFKNKSVEQILGMFTEIDKKGCQPELFYKELCANTGKTLVTISQIQCAEKVVELLKSHPFTSDIVNIDTQDGIEVFNELPILWQWKDVPCKSLIDKLIVNHNTKRIIPVDWKISWEVESFDKSYTKNKYWLQVGMYSMALQSWVKDHKLNDYYLEPLTYVVADPTGVSSPLMYKLTDEDDRYARVGFDVRNYHYMGTIEVLEMIEWHVQSATWNHTQEAAKNNGIMKLGIPYNMEIKANS